MPKRPPSFFFLPLDRGRMADDDLPPPLEDMTAQLSLREQLLGKPQTSSVRLAVQPVVHREKGGERSAGRGNERERERKKREENGRTWLASRLLRFSRPWPPSPSAHHFSFCMALSALIVKKGTAGQRDERPLFVSALPSPGSLGSPHLPQQQHSALHAAGAHAFARCPALVSCPLCLLRSVL